ncbi:MAG: Asp-tRNA(Asn)/Glu-tRNA(Gln) amidotransferase subunit GatC [Candidatus Falkowbacteria bacterium]
MLDTAKVQHIAHLARLELSDTEAEKMAGEMDKVLGYIDELNKLDTDGIEPTTQVTGLTNRTRADLAIDWSGEERQTALAQAPHEGNLIKVNKIL